MLIALLPLAVLTTGNAVSAPPDTGKGINSEGVYKKQCFAVQGVARNQKIDPKMFDHLIFVKNECLKPVRLKVCYHETDRCVDISVPPRSSKETWLGAFPSMRFFQYDLKEVPGVF